ncbi:acyltransferase family protein, partial [Nocardioides massiliensis]
RQWIVRSQHGAGPPAAAAYFRKRALRIWPLYAVTVILALTFIEANQHRGPRDWVVALLLADIYVTDTLPDGLTQMWSLATEVAFYAVLPLIMLVMVPRGRPAGVARTCLVLLAMVALSVLWAVGVEDLVPGASGRAVGQWLPAYLSWFAVGIGLAVLEVRRGAGVLTPRVAQRLEALAARPGACWVVVLGLLLVASTPVAGPIMLVVPTATEAVTKNLLYAVIGGLVVFTGVFTETTGFRRVMTARAGRHLGHVSYGIFCIHLSVLHLIVHLTGYELFSGNMLGLLALTLVASTAAAEVLYRFVERPAMRIGGRGGRAAARPTATPSENSTR